MQPRIWTLLNSLDQGFSTVSLHRDFFAPCEYATLYVEFPQLLIRNGLTMPGFDRDQNKPAGVEFLRDAAVDDLF